MPQAKAAPPEMTAEEREAAANADALAAQALAGEAGGASADDTPADPPAPRSAAARRAAGEQVSEPQGDPGLETSESPAPAPGPRNVVPAPDMDDMRITPEEIQQVRALRAVRATEIRAGIAAAPLRVGTDLDMYTLVHLRGCPQPERTETYEVTRSTDNREFTVHRCIECGAHQVIPH